MSYNEKEVFNEVLEDDCFSESERINGFLYNYPFEYRKTINIKKDK